MNDLQFAIQFLSGLRSIDGAQEVADRLKALRAVEEDSLGIEVRPDHWLVTGKCIVTGEQVGHTFSSSERKEDAELDPRKCLMANISRVGESMDYFRNLEEDSPQAPSAEAFAQLAREHRESIAMLCNMPRPRTYPYQPKCDSNLRRLEADNG